MSRYRTGGGPDAHRAGLGPHAPVAQRADDDGAGVGVHLHLIPRVLRADRPGINAGIKTRTVRHRHTHAKCLRAPRPDTSESLTPHESDLTDTHYGAVGSTSRRGSRSSSASTVIVRPTPGAVTTLRGGSSRARYGETIHQGCLENMMSQ